MNNLKIKEIRKRKFLSTK